MASATRRIEALCEEKVNPGGSEKKKGLMGSIRPLGFSWQRGIRQRPKLLRKDVVNQVFLEEAARAGAEGRAPTTNHIPDISSRGGPLWHHFRDADHAGHEVEMVDEQGSDDEAEEEKKPTRMPRTR